VNVIDISDITEGDALSVRIGRLRMRAVTRPFDNAHEGVRKWEIEPCPPSWRPAPDTPRIIDVPTWCRYTTRSRAAHPSVT